MSIFIKELVCLKTNIYYTIQLMIKIVLRQAVPYFANDQVIWYFEKQDIVYENISIKLRFGYI